jgi:hypothetical protein
LKICWNGLEKLHYSNKTGKWYHGTTTFYYIEHCNTCNEPFLSQNKDGKYCTIQCSANSEDNKNKASIIGSLNTKPKTKEHKRKISETKTGKQLGRNNPNYKNNWSEEQKNKQSEKLKGNGLGTKRPEHSLKMYGSGNPNWQDGISYEPYCEIWKDSEYKYSIRDRDNNECQNPYCNKNSDKLCIHHINYIKKDCHPDNLITLCFSCNAKANFNRDIWQSLYEEMIRNK